MSDPDAQVAGVFIEVEDTSTLRVDSSQQLAVVFGGFAHTSPRSFFEGQVTYEVLWNVPATPGVQRFVVSSLSADGNGRNNDGDEEEIETFDVVYGCTPQTYFRDLDGDGYGQWDWERTFCAGSVVEGFASNRDDCNDYSEETYPGAEERCNQRDDDCDGEVDENALPVELYPDADGDGFYSADERASGGTVMGCVPHEGFADRGGDCAPNDPDVYPEAEEVCDGRTDEDCDGTVDERVRPVCGVGWCRRESYSCDIADCFPGDPNEERCNFIDDDCDDEIDEGDLCPSGEQCLAGECRPSEFDSTGGSSTSQEPEDLTEKPNDQRLSGPSSESGAGTCEWGSGRTSPLSWLALLSGAWALSRRRPVGAFFLRPFQPASATKASTCCHSSPGWRLHFNDPATLRRRKKSA